MTANTANDVHAPTALNWSLRPTNPQRLAAPSLSGLDPGWLQRTLGTSKSEFEFDTAVPCYTGGPCVAVRIRRAEVVGCWTDDNRSSQRTFCSQKRFKYRPILVLLSRHSAAPPADSISNKSLEPKKYPLLGQQILQATVANGKTDPSKLTRHILLIPLSFSKNLGTVQGRGRLKELAGQAICKLPPMAEE
ncbi:hypothetical protein VFPPC_16481 [Pochonia chlamydosporia 170]|uniref:Uncharacterized protein n=1 Tax=Pochonia chlamydosporia 170 TaxID=1380566 RepID=A0A179FDE3_METCM|nr:hypothetical protein VFPPC_16481 [Pochonia chlamydosporia 170]OAQ63506.2 hypothetical protein VFPPC_16481 [Pochonia chlamydosporia 170]